MSAIVRRGKGCLLACLGLSIDVDDDVASKQMIMVYDVFSVHDAGATAGDCGGRCGMHRLYHRSRRGSEVRLLGFQQLSGGVLYGFPHVL